MTKNNDNSLLSPAMQTTITRLDQLNKEVHDRTLKIHGDNLPEYMNDDISVYFKPEYAFHDKFKMIGINTFNDFRKYKFGQIKTILIDGQPLFPKSQWPSVKNKVNSFGGLFYDDQKDIENAMTIIETGKRKRIARISSENKNDLQPKSEEPDNSNIRTLPHYKPANAS